MHSDPYPVEATIVHLFRELTKQGIRYAVLRNHEILPSLEHRDGSGEITDIDLVMDSRALPLWREIVKSVSNYFEWDVVTECDHWTQSACRAHHIEVFRFYRFSPLQFVQIDIFHAYVAWGVPILDEQELLDQRRSNERGIVCVEPRKEAIYALMKICWVAQLKNKNSKLKRYCERAVTLESTSNSVLPYIRMLFSSAGVNAFEALRASDLRRFSLYMRRAQLFAFARYSLAQPRNAVKHLIARRSENRMRFVTRPCGRVLRAHAQNEHQRELVRRVLTELRKNNVFDDWNEKLPDSPLSRNHRSVMEQGGLVVEWNDSQTASLKIDDRYDELIITRELIKVLIARDKILFSEPRREFEDGVHRATSVAARSN